MAEPQQPWRVLRQWRDRWPRLLLRAAVLAGLAVLVGVVWWRWGLAGLAVACGIALVGGLIVWAVVMPGRLAPPIPAETLTEITDPQARLEATDTRTRLHHDLRNGALQLLTVLAVLVGAGLGFQQLAEDRDQARQDRQLTRQGQASERFTRAIDQLGDPDRVETRIGGIYGLDQIAEQAPENTGPVGEVLLAWLHGRPRPDPPPDTLLRDHAPDIQAALSVLTKQRYRSIVTNRLDLHGLGLAGANLGLAHLFGVDLRDADLSGAYLPYSDLRSASLLDVDLRGAYLFRTNLRFAHLSNADLRRTALTGAYLSNADLRGADLSGVDLSSVNLRGVKVDRWTRWPPGFDWHSAGVRLAP